MKILVTGGLGFIGHQVVDMLRHRHDVTIVDNQTTYGVIPQTEIDYLVSERWAQIDHHPFVPSDIVSTAAMGTLFDQVRPDCVIHLASFPRQKVVNANPQLGSVVMSGGLINLLESAQRTGCQRFVYISSSMVYGDFEDQVREDTLCQPIGQYGILKLAGEWLVRDYARRCGMESVILRPSAVYGPRDVEDRVVSKFLLSAMRGENIKVRGADETLDFTYVDDAADGIVAAALVSSAAGKIYNITRGHGRSLLEAAEIAVQLAGRGKIELCAADPAFPRRNTLNIDAARADLGFSPKVDIEQGFQFYYDWLVNSFYWAKEAV